MGTKTAKCREGLEPTRTTDLTSKTTLTNDLVEAICTHKDIDPLKPGWSLYDHIDIDALDNFVESVSCDLQLQFTIDDVSICICKPDSETINIYVDDHQQ